MHSAVLLRYKDKTCYKMLFRIIQLEIGMEDTMDNSSVVLQVLKARFFCISMMLSQVIFYFDFEKSFQILAG